MICLVSKLEIWEKTGNLVGSHSLSYILARTFRFLLVKICPALLIQSKFLQYKTKSRGKYDLFLPLSTRNVKWPLNRVKLGPSQCENWLKSVWKAVWVHQSSSWTLAKLPRNLVQVLVCNATWNQVNFTRFQVSSWKFGLAL